MKSERFDSIVADRCDSIKSILASKAKEYAKGDRLHNFKVASAISNCTPERALKGMMMKHLVSVFDIIDDLDKNIVPTSELVDEKIGDLINYSILLEALLKERISHELPF